MKSILKSMRQSNLDSNILSSENKVIDRLLYRSTEMEPVYNELDTSLTRNQQEYLWNAILGAATFWTLEDSRRMRDEREQLKRLNNDIAKHATSLASLLKQRYELSESSGFHSYNDYHVLHWINEAASNNYLYQSHLKNELNRLSSKFDLKYWPRTFQVAEAIKKFADSAEIEATCEWTEELLASPKCSKQDYLRVLLKAVEDRKEYGPENCKLPSGFRMSDAAYATLINCTLDLGPDELVGAEYIKRSRQNIRDKEKKECTEF